MIHTRSPVTRNRLVAPNMIVLSFSSADIATQVKPGQFLNIRVSDAGIPFLRRPFSVYRVAGKEIEIIFNVVGQGTLLLSQKREGDLVDIIGPLGRPYDVHGYFDTAALVAGGLGVAPLPLLTAYLKKTKCRVVTFLGARTSDQIVSTHLKHVKVATDDGSSGYHGTVVALVRQAFEQRPHRKVKLFGCGPHPMLASLSDLAGELDIPCEVSLESMMACGMGICQGCPVELKNQENKYALICKEGTVFDTRRLVLK